MTQTRKAVGSRWTFRSLHYSVAALSGNECVITVNDGHPFPYVVSFDNGKTATAIDSELHRIVPSKEAR